MINDFVGGHKSGRRKPKTINPLPQSPHTPLPVLSDTEAPAEPAFQPPETIASTEAAAPVYESGNLLAEMPAKKSKSPFRTLRWTLGKKPTIILAAVVGVLICGGATAAAMAHHTSGKPTAAIATKVKPKPKPVIIYSNLTGLPIPDNSINQRPVTGAMIENSQDARPQSGLNQAGIVFEAIAEGGITRFLALFQDTAPDYLGPVRSVRPYYLQWCMGFDCSLAHVGGSPEGLADIQTWGAKDLDQFYNSSAYHRITSRYAPHNVYTSTAELNALEASKGFSASTYTGFAHKADTRAKAPNASSIDFAISSHDFNAHFDYVEATDSYNRSEGGAPHMELNKDGSQTQIAPKTVVAMVMQYGLEADDHHSQYNVVGTGQAFVFQDGTVTAATWSKADTKAPLTLKDAAGKDIALNRGQTWLTALSAANQATYH